LAGSWDKGKLSKREVLKLVSFGKLSKKKNEPCFKLPHMRRD